VLAAEWLVLLTDVPGVNDGGKVRSRLTAAEARELLKSGAVSGGMIPKLEAALRASEGSVPTAIIDGRQAGALRELVTRGPHDEALIGTRIG
jgi:acetylglutamate kinase